MATKAPYEEEVKSLIYGCSLTDFDSLVTLP